MVNFGERKDSKPEPYISKYQEMQYELSYWERASFFRDIDVVIVGSGIVGLNAAIRLRQLRPGRRVIMLERGPLPIGASTRNAGFACFGSLSELLDDSKQQSVEEVVALAAQRYRGLQKLRERLGDSTIDYLPLGGYEVFRPEDEERYEACLAALDIFNREVAQFTNHRATYRVADTEISSFGLAGVRHLIHNRAEGQLHTGKMMAALLQKARQMGVEIFNGLGVEAVEEQPEYIEIHTTAGWSIRSRLALVATNGFARHLLPELPVRPARNQVLITKPLPGLRFNACFHYDRGYYYFRAIDGRILLGGGRNIDPAGETTDHFGTTPPIRRALEDMLHQVVAPGQGAVIDSWWSGILGVGEEKTPIIRRLNDRLVVAVRLGGMGVAIGTLVGDQAAELLAGP